MGSSEKTPFPKDPLSEPELGHEGANSTFVIGFYQGFAEGWFPKFSVLEDVAGSKKPERGHKNRNDGTKKQNDGIQNRNEGTFTKTALLQNALLFPLDFSRAHA